MLTFNLSSRSLQQLSLMLNHAVVLFHLRNLFLKRVNKGVSVLDIRFVCIALSNSFMTVCLFSFTFQLQLLHFFCLRFVTEIWTFEVWFKLPSRTLCFFNLTGHLYKLLVFFIFYNVSLTAQVVVFWLNLEHTAFLFVKISSELANKFTVSFVVGFWLKGLVFNQ